METPEARCAGERFIPPLREAGQAALDGRPAAGTIARPCRRSLLGIAVSAALLAPALTAASPPRPAGADLDRLSRGDILFMDRLPPGRGAPVGNGGTAVALVHADPETVWQILERDAVVKTVAALKSRAEQIPPVAENAAHRAG